MSAVYIPGEVIVSVDGAQFALIAALITLLARTREKVTRLEALDEAAHRNPQGAAPTRARCTTGTEPGQDQTTSE